jgi:hypothetical protein
VAEGQDSLPYTLEAQQFLSEHQHPSSCDEARFLVWRMPNQGVMFDLRSLSFALALAVEHGRVLLVDRGAGWYWVDQEITPSSPDFFFAPPSHCELMHAMPVAEVAGGSTLAQMVDTKAVRAPELEFDASSGMLEDAVAAGLPYDHVPSSMRVLFARHADAAHKVDVRWWRAQASRYLFRELDASFRSQFMDGADKRGKDSKGGKGDKGSVKRLELLGRAPTVATADAASLVPNSIAIYVRHGEDEATTRGEERESPHLPPSLSLRQHYLPLAAAIRSLHPELDTLFVVTNDPAVVREAAALTDWTVIVHGEPRYAMSPRQTVEAGHSTPLVEAHKLIVNLMWASQARHFVCPIEAHFCRLLDDLRLTGDRQSAQFVTPVPVRSKKDIAANGPIVLDHFF